RTGERPKAWKPTAWIYAHMPLAASLVIVAVGLEQAVAKHLDHGEFWLTSGGMAGALSFMALISFANEKDGSRGINSQRAIRRLLGAGVVLIAGAVVQVVGSPHPTAWLIVLLIVAVAQVASDLVLNAQAD
ncbi:MAG: low temperature requirement protein A, partial [Acidimicrobiia bacterium]|nr:low temperature requirement protein A [Acidimicrobiia bacterium]